MMFTVQEGTCGHDLRCLGTDGDPGGLSPGALAAEVERTRAQLGAQFGKDGSTVEWRVAASLFHQSLASRILSVIAAALCHGVLLTPADRLGTDRRRAGAAHRPGAHRHRSAADWIEKPSWIHGPVMGAEHALTGWSDRSGTVARQRGFGTCRGRGCPGPSQTHPPCPSRGVGGRPVVPPRHGALRDLHRPHRVSAHDLLPVLPAPRRWDMRRLRAAHTRSMRPRGLGPGPARPEHQGQNLQERMWP